MDPGREITFAELQEWNTSLVNEIRNEKLVNGFTDPYGIRWDTNSAAITNLNGVCTLIALGLVSDNQTWRDADNTNHDMTPTQLVQLAGALAIFARSCYVTSWTHKYYISAFTEGGSPDGYQQLLAYDITTGWPS